MSTSKDYALSSRTTEHKQRKFLKFLIGAVILAALWTGYQDVQRGRNPVMYIHPISHECLRVVDNGGKGNERSCSFLDGKIPGKDFFVENGQPNARELEIRLKRAGLWREKK